MMKKLLLYFTALLLTGCLSPVKTNTTSNYMLYRVPDYFPKKHERHLSLLVLLPNTSPAYDTTQMAYSSLPYQISYFSQNSWAETPAQMIEPLMVQSLQKSHYFKTVLAAPFVGHYDYLLATQVLILEQDFT